MRPYSEDLRQRIVAAVKSGKSKSEVARQYEVSRQTVIEYMKKDGAGDLRAKSPPGRPPKLNKEQKKALEQQAKDYPDKTLQEHADLLEESQGVKLSFSGINTYFKRMGISYKKNAIR